MKINTVLGQIAPEDLGSTLVHEHLFVEGDFFVDLYKRDNMEERYKEILDAPLTLENIGLVARAGLYSADNLLLVEPYHCLHELQAFRRAGGATVVDLTVDGLGREKHFQRLPKVSKKSGVNIIAPTGYYIQPSHPANVAHQTVEEIAADMIRDIEEGIHGSDIKAGVIGEIGISPGDFTDEEKKVLKASAIAQKETSVPLTVHTYGDPPGKWNGFEAIEILQRADVDLNKVYMSHIDWTVAQEENWGCALKAARRGVFVAFDEFGAEWPLWSQDHSSEPWGYISAPTDLERIKGIKRLIEEGFEDKILLSHDIDQKLRRKVFGGHGLDHILTNVVNLFVYAGIGREILVRFMVTNPRRLFS